MAKALDPDQILRQLEIAISQRKMYTYRPYGHPDTLCPHGELFQEMKLKGEWEEWSNKPWQLEFHQAGKSNQERGIIGANRPGKTYAPSMEVAFHMTGEYPDWWDGKRFDNPVLVWTGSPTNESSRDIIQKALLGGTDRPTLGTGSVPRERLYSNPRYRQCGVGDVVDTFKVRHVSGGISACVLKSYEQGWRKWQGTAPHVIWLDEEPDTTEDQKKIYSEALTRLLTSHGIMMVTFSPLLGMTDLVRKYQSASKGVWSITATWDDAPHLNREERERMKASYPDNEIQTRSMGVPMMGYGRVFDVSDEDIVIPPIKNIPDHWARIKGIDFGIDHPAAVGEIAWDRDQDVIYIIKDWKKRDADAEEHAEVINSFDPWVPVSWPHDGTTREKSNGVRLKDFYVRKGVRMLGMSARYKNETGSSQPVEPIVVEMQERSRNGGLKVFSTCTEFLNEWRNYHRKEDGKLTKTQDDMLKAIFYAVMMKRYAVGRSSYFRSSNNDMPRAFTTRI